MIARIPRFTLTLWGSHVRLRHPLINAPIGAVEHVERFTEPGELYDYLTMVNEVFGRLILGGGHYECPWVYRVRLRRWTEEWTADAGHIRIYGRPVIPPVRVGPLVDFYLRDEWAS